MSTRMRALLAGATAVVLACPVVVVATASPATPVAPAAAAPTLPTGFQDTIAIGNITEATSVAFAPNGTAFVAEKPGTIRTFDYSAGAFESTGSLFANLSTSVNNYWDRGLTGIEVDPQFPTRPYVYVNYTYDRDPRDNPAQVPKWGEPGGYYDECASEASISPVRVGCLVNIRVSRLTAVAGPNGWVMQAGSEKELVQDACIQFGSHASGDVLFGADGYLYASAGEGASFTTADWGQGGNPCPGDPANANEGGSLRSQDYQTSGDPLGLGGAVFRVNPDTGAAPDGSTQNSSRLVAYGQRNPWRLAFRGPTGNERFELWSGDVGSSTWEEINRITDVRAVTTPVNRGWPCYEGTFTGSARQGEWDALNKPICENLYTQGVGAVAAPYFSYQTRGPLLTPDEDCQNDTSSVSGIAFGASASNYPAAYKDSLFFTDFARSCIWRLGKKQDGSPDPTSITPFVQGAATPVDMLVGPGGDLYYVDYGLSDDGVPTANAAAVHRITYTSSNAAPTARIVADKVSGAAPLTVSFDGTTSTDPDSDTLTYAWDLDGDGQYDDSTLAKPSRTYPIGNVTVRLRVDDGHGHQSTASQVIQAGNTAPVIGTVTPAESLTWKVDDTIAFSGTASDAQDGALPASAFSWNVAIRHCPGGVCHTHSLQTYSGVSSGSFTAPDHEYPSHLLVTLTVTDAQGLTASKTVQVNPKSVTLGFASSPTGAALTVDSEALFAPASRDFIVGHTFNVIAPADRQYNGANYTFASWSDGVTTPIRSGYKAPASPATLTATYARQNRLPTVAVSANPTSGTAPLTVSFTTTASDPDGDNASFTYEWALDGDGLFNDGGGATKQKQYATAGARTVQVRVTDTHGGQDTDSVVVNVSAANQPPVARLVTTPTTPTGPAPFAVSFSAATSTDADTDPLTYAWDLDNDGSFDDGTASTASRTFAVGSHVVKVRVSDGRGGSDDEQVTVTSTNQPPVAVLAPTNPSGKAPLAVTFNANGSSDPNQHALTFAWDLDNDGAFDDGTGATASRTFAAGSHVVRLQATDSVGATNVAQTTVTAAANTQPTAHLTADRTTGNAPLAVSFDASTSTDPDGDALTYEWALDGDGLFNDGGGATKAKTFTTPGTRVVQVRVGDGRNGSDTESLTVTVNNRAPVANVTATPSSGYVPLAVSLDASASSDPDGDGLTYEWALDADGLFNDGGGATKSKTYADAGPVEVKVRVSDGRGATDIATVRVSVGTRNPEGIVYSSPGDPGKAPLTTTFFAQFTDPEGKALTYKWDLDADGQFDDGGTAASQQATFTKVGVNRVFVQVSDPDGGQWVAFATIQVLNTNPTVTVSASPRTGHPPFSTTFTATASDPDATSLTYAWDLDGDGEFDDGGTAARQAASFSTLGAHTVAVQVTDADAGRTTASASVTVTERPPARSRLTVKTRPGGLDVTVQGTRRNGAYSGLVAVGSKVRVSAPKRQKVGRVVYVFVRWSDGRRRSHTVVMTKSPLTLRAVYRRQT